MSRQSPLGFVFSMVIEIAAVVAIVSFLPRVDLRPPAIAAADTNLVRRSNTPSITQDALVSPASWTSADRGNGELPTRETSYYQRPANTNQLNSSQPTSSPSFPTRAVPPLIEVDASTPQYVEQRLDRASQQLVNSVGSYVAQAAGEFVNYPARSASPSTSPAFPIGNGPITPPAPVAVAPSTTAPQLTFAPPQAMPARRSTSGSAPTQPRPWLRY